MPITDCALERRSPRRRRLYARPALLHLLALGSLAALLVPLSRSEDVTITSFSDVAITPTTQAALEFAALNRDVPDTTELKLGLAWIHDYVEGAGWVRDSDLEKLSHFPNLRRLTIYSHLDRPSDLDGTADSFRDYIITDRGVRHLLRAPRLSSLLIADSQISDQGLATISRLRRLEDLSLPGSRNFGARGIRSLWKLRHLRSLRLTGSSINDEALIAIGRLKRLFYLEIEGTPVTDRGIAAIANLPLLYLGVGGTRISDRGICALDSLTNLRMLSLHRTQVTDGGLRCVASLSRISALDLRDTAITGEGLGHLAKMRSLASLRLDNTRLNDSSIIHLRELVRLSDLSVNGTSLTDFAIDTLTKLPALQRISLHDTKITRNGLRRFRSARPNVEVSADGSP